MPKKNTSVKKAPPKTVQVNLGKKRQCPHCATKFYDFSKPEVQCPKCERTLDPNAEIAFRRIESKRPHSSRASDALDEEGDIVVDDNSPLESADDLEDTDVTKTIEVEDDE